MKIGFYVKWPIHQKRRVVGDSIVAEILCKNLRKLPNIKSAEVYAPDIPIKSRLDAVIYMNSTPPVREWADKHILYWQNGYSQSPEELFKDFYSHQYDGYAFFSRHLLERHLAAGKTGIYLPFCADTSFYYPREPDERLSFDVTYVGGDIKGTYTTMRYIYPALDFNFALFGGWKISPRKLFSFEVQPYQEEFKKKSQGRIPEPDVPVLYSSSKIMLNTNITQSRDLGVISLRTFQVLACKGFLISDPLPGMEQELAGKVVFTDGYNDLTEKIKYYLTHEEERREIAENGYEYVMNSSQSAASLAERLLLYLEEIMNEEN